ncbi:MAG: hypothetical protein CVT89_08820 [Candidatus Altiarchaeales archaeon HGW-Altiarchaeales-2]|nr:MAG: hypothetical protein CVT89_08820 [Candidatus Altiarchaeales archaeon HGW-Altiarchaeales-2]
MKDDNVLLHSNKIKKNREIYKVYHLSELKEFKEICGKSGINCDVTIMNSGILKEKHGENLSGEMYPTYGHIHTAERNEIYKVIRGRTFLLLVDEDAKKETIIDMKKGDEYLINFKYPHRVYTFGSAVVLGFVPNDAGHDYDAIKNRGFPYHLFYDQKSKDILFKKNKKFGNFDIALGKPQNIDSENLFWTNTGKMKEILGI